MSARPLDCEEVIERLFEYLDRELDERKMADIDHHLARCRDCFTRAQFETRLRSRVAAAGTVKAPPRLHQRIRQLLDRFDDGEENTHH